MLLMTPASASFTFFIVQPCDGARRRASGWNVMANKIWANFHGVYLVGMSMRSSSRRQSCIRSAMRLTILGEGMLVFELRMSGALCARVLRPAAQCAALDQEAADLIDR